MARRRSRYNPRVPFKFFITFRLRVALLVALLQAFLPVASYAAMAGKSGLIQEICSADGTKRSFVLVDGEMVPVPKSSHNDHSNHCALCLGGHGALPGLVFDSTRFDAPTAQLITIGASLYQPQAVAFAPPPRGPPATL